MAQPKDEFDTLPDDLLRVGAHRGPKLKGRGWIGFAWAALSTGVLVAAGVFALNYIDNSFSFELPFAEGIAAGPTASPTPRSTVVPITDPTTIKERKISITILNGTAVTGLERTARTTLRELKWKVGSIANASSKREKKTIAYYSDPKNEDVALGIIEAIGTGEVRLSDAFIGAPITLVLGSDYDSAEG